VVGERISIQSFSGTQRDFAITGVLREIPENSVTVLNDDNHNSFFIPTNTFTYFGRFDFENWANIYIPSYIELKDGASGSDLDKAIRQLIQQNASDVIKQNLTVQPIPLKDYYVQKDNGLVRRMLYALSFVGLFILLMAIVNFINISISSSSTRIKEIGIRKVLGGLRKHIVIQFLAESIILVSAATILAISAYPFTQTFFAQLVGKQIPSLYSFPLYFIFIPVAVIVFVGLLAGLYPAIILSSLKSADSIKGKLKTVKENVLLRKSLTGFQFCIASIVLIVAFIVSQQVSYFFSRSLGYNKEYILSAQLPRDWSRQGVQKMETVRNEFTAMPQISSATLSYEIPNGSNGGQPPVYRSVSDSTQAIAMQLLITDENYLSTYQIPLRAGSFFDGRGMDSAKVVMNEQALNALGYKDIEKAVGERVRIPGDPTIYTIKGVTNDFHFGSMQDKIAPIIFFNVQFAPQYRFLSFKIHPGNVRNTIEAIQKKWSLLLPGTAFEYSFMDDTLKSLYKNEIQLKKASYAATVLSLVIVLLGVIGLVSLSIQKRTKEIGIRKVLGASVSNIMSLFIKEVLWVILVAGVIACPVAWLVMNGWLNDYAYRISLTPKPFLLSVIGLAFLTAILIALQTIKAGRENPVKSLRTE
jgi:putative ABC transport system permease protein